ncbi:MAG TPA: gfo/Idh/MocA family oxidoreductase, partial [Spirochaeta sp.]|nr:gfo/Idh/MocA family oxidoreductase [Spirochaeta sp.]
MKKYKWGVIGTGKIANRFATALNNIPEEAEFYAVGSRSQ